jgi:hypothetical protein
VAAVWACSTITATETAPPRSLLFIGNSLTYTNDLPAMVERVAGQRATRCGWAWSRDPTSPL